MKKTLLAVLAHPDDESFGPGGTLAKYAAEGVEVHICIATDGVAGSVEDGFEEAANELVNVRAQELEQAVAILGAALHRFNYRDSGMRGDPANEHPDAFINSDDDEAIGKVVQLIRQIKPQVVITNDETGGYYHPDHIRCYEITTAAFHAAAVPDQYPELGLAPYQAQRLYYTALPSSLLKIFSWMLRLRGQNPHTVGRNKDIDLTRLGYPRKNLHGFIKFDQYWDIKIQASAAHASQGGGGMNLFLPAWFQKRFLATDTFIRAYPPVPAGFREHDLFNSHHG
ncbi:MAG: GlcNAc-PI de-N-acetylase [Chloroflexi bacterium]|nr:GlcNAc-PI de-N-acetylase [Chloroflexota bacterium]